jgi:hypothetical protein
MASNPSLATTILIVDSKFLNASVINRTSPGLSSTNKILIEPVALVIIPNYPPKIIKY